MDVDEIYDIKLSDIEISELNVRQSAVTKELDQLAASIRENGLLQPIILVGDPGNPPYKLVAGQRRYLAHEQLRRRRIRAVFIASELSDDDIVLLSLTENLQSIDLNHADAMRAVTRLYETFGQDERKVQKRTGLSIRRIRNYLKIEAQASPKMKQMLEDGTVSTEDVKRAIRAAQSNLRKAEKLLELMTKYPLTKHQKRRVVEFGQDDSKASAEKILKEAMKPRVERSIMVSLPEDVRVGLQEATEHLSMEAEEIVSDVLEEWLSDQGFINAE